MAQTTAELIEQGQDPSKALTVPEKKRLKACEVIISKGLYTFRDVGMALYEIDTKRLYKETHKTFPNYCRDKWGLGKSRAYQNIDAAKTVQLLEDKMSTIVDTSDTANEPVIIPVNEAQARPLTLLKDPDDQVKAWNIVLRMLNENPKKKLTSSLIKKAVKEVRGESVQKKIKETKQAVEKSNVLTPQFQSQYQILLDIVVASKNNGFKDCSKKMVKKHLQALLDIVDSDD